ALDLLPIEWDDGAHGEDTSEKFLQMAHAALDEPGAQVVVKKGNPEAALKGAAKVVEAVYDLPYLDHAFMEPMNCTAQVTADRVARFRAGLGPDGNPVAWINRVIGIDQNPPADPAQTVRGLHQVPYAVANQLFDFHLRQTHVPTGVWTSVGRSQNEFYLESFMDELAHAAGTAPYHYRRALLA